MKLQILFLGIVIGFGAFGNTPQLQAQEKVASPPADIESLSWIAGHWKGEAMQGSFEETWSPPMAGAMMGMFKFAKNDGVDFYEILTIVPKDESLVLRLKHFDAQLLGWEEKDKSVEFPLVEITDTEARFDGLVFKKISPDKMRISVVIHQGDKENEIHFNCTRSNLDGGSADKIRGVLKMDELISNQRNEATRHISLSDAIKVYVNGLGAIDFDGCPEDVTKAFHNHRDAWEASLKFFESHSEIRGEMHELFDKIRQTDETAAKELESHFKAIMDTWTEVEAANKKHGVQ